MRYDLDLRERMIRMEGELCHQRELMGQGFRLMERRFEDMRENMNLRFQQMGKRFEVMTQRIRSFMHWSFAFPLGVAGLAGGDHQMPALSEAFPALAFPKPHRFLDTSSSRRVSAKRRSPQRPASPVPDAARKS